MLAGFEEAGHCRRGYVIEKLGAAQFAASATVDRLREFAADGPRAAARAHARRDRPGQPVRCRSGLARARDVTHRPGRKAGGLVVLVDGALALYLERGGRTLLSFTDDEAPLQAAADALARAVHEGQLGRLPVERTDGTSVLGPTSGGALGAALAGAGFR